MSWQKRFDEIWEVIYVYDRDIAKGYSPYIKCTNKLKQFISDEIEKDRQRIKKRMEALKKYFNKEPLGIHSRNIIDECIKIVEEG